jgi:hypothetical protein
VDLTRIHNLSGPIAVEGAKPGDVLVVDIPDVTPFPNMQWGYTGVFESEPPSGDGLTPQRRTAAGCSPTTLTARPPRPSGTLRECTPCRGTSPACASRASPTP